jgi:hypothetical protein
MNSVYPKIRYSYLARWAWSGGNHETKSIEDHNEEATTWFLEAINKSNLLKREILQTRSGPHKLSGEKRWRKNILCVPDHASTLTTFIDSGHRADTLIRAALNSKLKIAVCWFQQKSDREQV